MMSQVVKQGFRRNISNCGALRRPLGVFDLVTKLLGAPFELLNVFTVQTRDLAAVCDLLTVSLPEWNGGPAAGGEAFGRSRLL